MTATKSSGESIREKSYYTISEVAQIVGVSIYVLRSWERAFRHLRPRRSRDKRGRPGRMAGVRMYRPEDVHAAATIRDLIYVQGYTVEGAQRALREKKGSGKPIRELRRRTASR